MGRTCEECGELVEVCARKARERSEITGAWLPMDDAPRQRIVAWNVERNDWRVVTPVGGDRVWFDGAWRYWWRDVEEGSNWHDGEFSHFLLIDPPH